ncbi:expressed unknown protein [Seminavis robusta]|uniref:Uncharacterized protein n=1 Tax=Seminavis robusta TaxID=568900 RepID=A0A9N8EXS0_9STRA|nr:expressed unknown protein [Seminavis robusta]|eukprot:Sro1924_g305690.1 n/a (225) ;mRNA; f:5756-6430
MVFLLSAGCMAVKGGIAAKKKIETRKNPTLDGDFIVAPLSTNGDSKRPLIPAVMRRSLSKLTQSMTSRSSSYSDDADGEEENSGIFTMGQEVLLKNMKDSNLNGTRALVLQDCGRKRGVLVQFLEQKDGYDNYHETGSMLSHENMEAIVAHNNTNDRTSSSAIPVGTLVELQNLSASSEKNGFRGMVVEPSNGMAEGRVAVLLEGAGEGTLIVSVKPENCKTIG